MALRESHNLGLGPALPAFSEITNSWLPRRMTTGEGALFLKEFLIASGFKMIDLENVGCHSLKTTLLSWVAKGDYLGVADRLLMGHHVIRENQSVVAYSRDEPTRIMQVVHSMLRDVKTKTFKPDANRAERLQQAIGGELEEWEQEQSEEESDAGYEDVEPVQFPRHDRPEWDDLPIGYLNRLRIHSFSGVVHICGQRDNRKFICGRTSSKNFAEIPAGSGYDDLPVCLQCRPGGLPAR